MVLDSDIMIPMIDISFFETNLSGWVGRVFALAQTTELFLKISVDDGKWVQEGMASGIF
jgi:hypothetical protein